MPGPSGKILVIRGGAIGDFILTLPALAALRETFPEVRLELLGYPRVTPLALASGLVHHARSIEARPLASFFAKNGPLPEEWAEYFGSFAVILSYLFDPDRIFQDNIGRCSKAQFLVGPHRPDEQGNLHATDTFLRPLERLAIFAADPIPRLAFSSTTDVDSRIRLPVPTPDAPDRWLAVHPGSGSERKNWPEAKWLDLLGRLAVQTKLRFLLVGGEAEGDRLSRLAVALPPDRFELARSLPLAELALLLTRCAVFVGHDSGISHMAAAVGLPVVALWGETRAEVWRPRSERVQLLSSSAGLTALGVDDVLAAVAAATFRNTGVHRKAARTRSKWLPGSTQ